MQTSITLLFLSFFFPMAANAGARINCFELRAYSYPKLPSFASPQRIAKEIASGALFDFREKIQSAPQYSPEKVKELAAFARASVKRVFFAGRNFEEEDPIVVMKQVTHQSLQENLEVVHYETERGHIQLGDGSYLEVQTRTPVLGVTGRWLIRILEDVDTNVAIRRLRRLHRAEAYGLIIVPNDLGTFTLLYNGLLERFGKENVRLISMEFILIRR